MQLNASINKTKKFSSKNSANIGFKIKKKIDKVSKEIIVKNINTKFFILVNFGKNSLIGLIVSQVEQNFFVDLSQYLLNSIKYCIVVG